MLVADRQRKIVELVNEKISVRVTELSQLFNVTEETIRRDLEKLEKLRALRRSHGGAVRLENDSLEISYREREITNQKQKRAIAQAAIQFIEPGDKIILDASTTSWYMAQEIPNQPLTVITNSINVALALSKKDNIQVISVGGMLSPKSLSFVGPLASRSLRAYHVSKAFISCQGIDFETGISDSNEWQALLRKEILAVSDKTILLVDSSKFQTRTFVQITNSLTDIDMIITDHRLTKEEHQAMQHLSIVYKCV
ncbi:DeoR/GlpR family DNA-binding transcription regulator [Pullulanibacillus sp. KACC 23026]|uniref:DeoR/GlpR family DNA-binding transcription regulator n=1 Tax=Pullulanibacillus sp. KACC 23026 TaxID=3028315 RepID=UPI0023AF8F88|nr:DeoR/GlpR family DNA-binding transcription regulator [Pullulanibacillus sp. KACC 23026]WEG10933.1 DeoR/GlpR family DNA-binding transcription regulator [Pullulanibacillus sp. KACC 23026]